MTEGLLRECSAYEIVMLVHEMYNTPYLAQCEVLISI